MRQFTALCLCLALAFLSGCAFPLLSGMNACGKVPLVDPLRALPPQIQAATACQTLEPFLRSADEATRRAAVRGLGQIGGDDAVALIVGAYQTESPFPFGYGARGVKHECLNALCNIRSDKAKQAVLGLVMPVLQQGRGRIDGGEGNMLVHGMEALTTWPNDREIGHLFREIALEEKYADRLPYQLREAAYEGHLECEMARTGIVGVEAQFRYLADQLTDAGVGHSYDWTKSGKTQDAIQNSARRSALVRLGAPAEPLIRARLASLPAQDEKRRQALTRVLGTLKTVAYAKSQAEQDIAAKLPQPAR